MLNVLVTGSHGQLGSELKEIVSHTNCSHKFFFTTSCDLDITHIDKIEHFIQKNNIHIIINCAAYTAVDKAEDDTENANIVNHLAVKNIATLCKQYDIKLIHISTDYVFDGKNYKPYVEDDITAPQGIYGQTKCDGEKAILAINPLDTIIIRTSWVYSSFGSNFVKTMLRLSQEKETLGVIFDQVGTPTYARDLAQAILDILPQIDNHNVEIYHYANEGVCSWYDFATSIFELSQKNCHISPIETKAYPTPAKRPHYGVLNKTKIKNTFGITVPHWKESLIDCLQRLNEL